MSKKIELFDDLENEWQKEWVDMPEFNQKDLKPIQKIVVSFETEEDVRIFAEMTGYKITKKTKSIWFPFRKKDEPKKYCWKDE